MATISSSETFAKRRAIFLFVGKTRIFQVTGANQNARKLLSTDLVNTNRYYAKPGTNQIKSIVGQMI